MKWISVEEALPICEQLVLSYGFYGCVVAKVDDSNKWGALDTDWETGEPWLKDRGTVTYWMPLPEPPADKEDMSNVRYRYRKG